MRVVTNVKSTLAILMLAAAPGTTLAQTTTATLLGTVRDSTGAVIPQAQVTARNRLTAFRRGALTDESGTYLITNLPVGEYALTAEKDGFRRYVQEGITLVVNQNARVDVVLLSVQSRRASPSLPSPRMWRHAPPP